MKTNFNSLNAIISTFLIWTLFLNTFPVKAQDIVTSEDISGSSSVFVFRKSRTANQSKFVGKSAPKKSVAPKAQTRKSVREQVAKATPKREKIVKVDPNTVAANKNKGNTGKPSGKTGGKTGTGKTGTGKTETTDTSDNTSKINNEQTANILAGVGETFLERGELDKAIFNFKESLRLNPNNNNVKLGLSEALSRKADIELDNDNSMEALRLYDDALTNDPNNASALAGTGSIYDELKKPELALENYLKAVSINAALSELFSPIGVIYYQKGEIAKADEYLTKAVAVNPNDDQTQMLLGLIRYKQNRNEEAIAAFTKSNSISNSAEAHYFLGEIYDRLDRDKDAITEYNEAVKLNPNYTEAWFDLGVSYYNRKRYEEAVNAYNQAIRLKNDNYQFYENLGDAYRQLKQFDKAEGPYGLAVTLAERDKTGLVDKITLADLYSKYGYILGFASKWRSAIDALNKAVSNSPDKVDFTNLGWAYYNSALIDLYDKSKADKLGDKILSEKYGSDARVKLENGRNALQKATAMDENFVASFMNLGMTLTELNDYQGAIAALTRCIQLRDKWHFAYNELGYAYKMSGNLDEAVKNFRKATDIEKNYVTGLYNLSFTEMLRGNAKEARKVQDRLRKIDPNKAKILELQWMNPGNMIKQKVDSKNPLNKLPFPY